jgi:hypothetical protein
MALASATIALNAYGSQTAALDLGTASFPFSGGVSFTLTDGTTAGKADRIFTDTRTLAASATENIDLAGSLTDAFGTATSFATIKAVIVSAASGNTNSVQVTRPASNGVPLFMAAGDGIALRPGGVFAWVAGSADATGVAVTAGTGDLLTITNSAGSTGVDYSVMIVGASA